MKSTDTTKIVVLYIIGIGTKGTPSGHLYARMMPDGIELQTHLGILNHFEEQGIVTINNHFVTLTDKGLEMHKRIEDILIQADKAVN